jgi:hypothetical protein
MGQLWKPLTKLPLKNHFGCNLQLININHTIIPVIFGILYHLTSKIIFFLVSIIAFNPKGPKSFFRIILHLFERRVLIVKSAMGPYCRKHCLLFFFPWLPNSWTRWLDTSWCCPDTIFLGIQYTPKVCAWHDPKFVFGHHPSFSRNMDWAKGRQGKKMQAVQNAIETNC